MERSIGLMIPEIQLLKEDTVLWWTTPGEFISLYENLRTFGHLSKTNRKNNRNKQDGKQVQYVCLLFFSMFLFRFCHDPKVYIDRLFARPGLFVCPAGRLEPI